MVGAQVGRRAADVVVVDKHSRFTSDESPPVTVRPSPARGGTRLHGFGQRRVPVWFTAEKNVAQRRVSSRHVTAVRQCAVPMTPPIWVVLIMPAASLLPRFIRAARDNMDWRLMSVSRICRMSATVYSRATSSNAAPPAREEMRGNGQTLPR